MLQQVQLGPRSTFKSTEFRFSNKLAEPLLCIYKYRTYKLFIYTRLSICSRRYKTDTESSIAYSQYNGAAWTSYVSSATGTTMTVTSTLDNTNAALVNTDDYGGIQTTNPGTYYKSIANGDWNGANTWETANNLSFVGATPTSTPPTSSNSVYILIQSGNTVTVGTSVTAPDLHVSGTLENLGATSITATGFIYIDAGGTYLHNMDGGTIPTAISDPASTCNISGVSNNNPAGLSTPTTFGNFTFSSPGLVGGFGSNMTIAGNLQVTAGEFSLGNNTITIAGNVINSAVINGSSNNATLGMNGTASQTISGSGTWASGYLSNLTINNTTNSVVNVNCPITLQYGLT